MEEEADLAANVALLEMRLHEKEAENDELLHFYRRLAAQRAYDESASVEVRSRAHSADMGRLKGG